MDSHVTNTEVQARLWEMGIYLLDPVNNERFRAGKLLVVDRRTEPALVGTADVSNFWLNAYLLTL